MKAVLQFCWRPGCDIQDLPTHHHSINPSVCPSFHLPSLTAKLVKNIFFRKFQTLMNFTGLFSLAPVYPPTLSLLTLCSRSLQPAELITLSPPIYGTFCPPAPLRFLPFKLEFLCHFFQEIFPHICPIAHIWVNIPSHLCFYMRTPVTSRGGHACRLRVDRSVHGLSLGFSQGAGSW